MKIVIDTNLLVAGYFNKKSASRKILEMIFQNKIQLLWTQDIRKEMVKIVRNIKARPKFQDAINKIFKKENQVFPRFRIKEIKDDPQDNKFLEAAFFGKAHLIVSQDKDLLKLKNFKGILILPPRKALQRLRESF